MSWLYRMKDKVFSLGMSLTGISIEEKRREFNAAKEELSELTCDPQEDAKKILNLITAKRKLDDEIIKAEKELEA